MIPKHTATKSLGNSVLNKTTLIENNNSFQKNADITSADLVNMLKQYNKNANSKTQKKFSNDKQINNSNSLNQNDIT